MKVFGLAGWSGAGKTTLMVALLPRLIARGVRVSTIKHVHHDIDLDKPGKDTFRHREAGATEVVMASVRRWAVMHELRDEDDPSADDLIARMAPVDLILIEGFKAHPHPKIEVHRPAVGKPLLWPDVPGVVAVASPAPLPDLPLPRLDLDDPDAIARFILDFPAEATG